MVNAAPGMRNPGILPGGDEEKREEKREKRKEIREKIS